MVHFSLEGIRARVCYGITNRIRVPRDPKPGISMGYNESDSVDFLYIKGSPGAPRKKKGQPVQWKCIQGTPDYVVIEYISTLHHLQL